MEVFDIDNRLLGSCDVKDRQLTGVYFIVSIAEEGPYCQECKAHHTVFNEIRFDITITAPWNLALIARDPEGVKHLPGFTAHENTLPKL